MKKILLIIGMAAVVTFADAQDFKTAITTAKTSYGKGDLEDAHFALQQALQEMDIIIGKEVIKLLPASMGDMAADIKADNVYGNVGYLGTTIHRDYGTTRKADLSIMSNSLLASTINTVLNMPFGGSMGDANTKTVKVSGYKAQLVKEANSDGTNDYTLNIPLGSSIITFKVDKTTDTEILAFANTLPLEKIAALIQ